MNFNINKMFRRLPIRMKLVIAFAMMALLPLATVGAYGLLSSKATLRDSAIREARHRVDLLKADMDNLLSRVWLDTRYLEELGKSHALQDPVPAGELPSRKTDLEDEIVLFSGNHPLYFQIRFIDSDDFERLRIVKANGQYVALDPRGPQTPSRFYRHVTQDIAAGSFISIPVEIKHPLKPDTLVSAVSLIRPSAVQGVPDGGLWIVDLYADLLVEQLRRPNVVQGGELVLCDAEGRYLYHPARKMSWQQLLANRESETVFSEFDAEEARIIISGTEGTLSGTGRDIVSYTPVWTDPARHKGGYVLYYRIPAAHAYEPIRRFTLVFSILVFVTLALVAVSAYIGASQLTSPLLALSRAAHVVAAGNSQHRIEVSSNDEIESLADDFNRMAIAIRDREALILDHERALRRHAEHLEQEVEARTSELRESHQMLARSEKLAAVGRLAAGVAHEINNPIGIILNRIESMIAARQPEDRAEIHSDLAVLAKHARRISTVTENLLRFSRPRPFEPAVADLVETCQSVVSLIRPEFERRSVVLHFARPADPVLIDCDPDQLEQVLLNLLDNALHVSSGGQTVTIELTGEGRCAILRISDEGPGIPPENVDRIFDPFFTTKDVGQGSGLGLSICEKIIQDHGGTIRVAQNKPAGAVFIVEIPFRNWDTNSHG